MKEHRLGTWAGLQWTMTRSAIIGAIGLWLVVAAVMVAFNIPIGSALLAGVILTYLGLSGEEAFYLLHQKLMVALYNQEFAAYLTSLPPVM